MSQGYDKALKSSLLTAAFWGNLLWTWNQTLPFRGKSLLLSFALQSVIYSWKAKSQCSGVEPLLSECSAGPGEMLLTLGPGGLLRALGSVCDSDLRQFWSYCSSFLGALQVSPFLTDFCLRIFPHPFCNLTNCSRALKMEQVKVSFKRCVFKLLWAVLNIHFRWSVG